MSNQTGKEKTLYCFPMMEMMKEQLRLTFQESKVIKWLQGNYLRSKRHFKRWQ
jgi:hypothetical protein